MPILIDGNNLLFAAREVAALRAIDQEKLCRFIGRWTQAAQTDAAIVFDGPVPRLGVVQQLQSSGVAVQFSGGRSADDVIVDILDRAEAPGTYTVVSSDHAIQHAARYRRAAAVDSEAFLGEVLDSSSDDETVAPDAPPEKPHTLSSEETDTWLRRFGEDPDEPPDDTELMM